MITALRVITPPAVPAVTPALAQQHARIDATYDTGYVTWLIETATEFCEAYLNRSLITKTLEYVVAHDRSRLQSTYGLYGSASTTMYPGLGRFGHGSLELPRAPLQAVASITRNDPVNGDISFTPAMYAVSNATDPGRVQFLNGHHPNWTIHSLSVVYTAGYGDTPASIPAPIRHAILMTVASLYEHRGDEDGMELPVVAERLMDPYRQDVF